MRTGYVLLTMWWYIVAVIVTVVIIAWRSFSHPVTKTSRSSTKYGWRAFTIRGDLVRHTALRKGKYVAVIQNNGALSLLEPLEKGPFNNIEELENWISEYDHSDDDATNAMLNMLRLFTRDSVIFVDDEILNQEPITFRVTAYQFGAVDASTQILNLDRNGRLTLGARYLTEVLGHEIAETGVLLDTMISLAEHPIGKRYYEAGAKDYIDNWNRLNSGIDGAVGRQLVSLKDMLDNDTPSDNDFADLKM